MWKKYVIPAAIGAAAAATAVKAALYTPKKKDFGAATEEKVDAKRAQEHLSKAISIPTISYPDKADIDFTQLKNSMLSLKKRFLLFTRISKKRLFRRQALYIIGRAQGMTLTPLLCLLIRMLFPFPQARSRIGLTSPSAVITTANSSGAEVLLT